MAETPKTKKSQPRSNKTPSNLKQLFSSPDHYISPQTPQISIPTNTTTLRRSLRLTSTTPKNSPCLASKSPKNNQNAPIHSPTTISMAPASPHLTESKKKRKNEHKQNEGLERKRVLRSDRKRNASNGTNRVKKRVYYKKVVYDGGEFSAGDDVYVKRREDAASDDEDPVVEECRVCFKAAGRRIMIECDECLNGFHLNCLRPPLKEVPEGNWICNYCEARKSGQMVDFPEPPKGKKRARTARDKLISSDLWAAHIESVWKEVDGTYWFRARWYIIPEETAAGRQPHNLRRELYRTNDFADVEMESIIRHCYVMNPKEFAKAANEGDDVFMCEYEYNIQWHSFKRIAEIDNNEEDGELVDSDNDWNSCDDSDSDAEEDGEYEYENTNCLSSGQSLAHSLAANSRKGRIFGLQRIGAKKIPEHVRCHKQTDLERAKATLLLATLPKSLPCRDKEMDEITTFIKGAISDEQCLGRCLYIHGVPGTGKTMSVLAVIRNLRSEVDAGSIRPYCFVEINGLKLASPENIYSVIYEGLSGHKVGWKKALHFLTERFSDENKHWKEDTKPCVLLIDELDLLVTRNQSVLYNILDWPTKPNSKLIVIGIANTMDLPEKLLPRISSRMGIQRLCFGPYNYQQLQEIISSRLKGIDAFEKLAIEFASRKVAAVSGDARRALEICRRAAELTDYRAERSSLFNSDAAGKVIVGMADVEAAIKEMFQAPHIQVIRSSSKLSKIFLAAMVHELYKTGMGETTFEKLAVTVSCFCSSNGETVPGYDTLLKVGCKLGECRILLCEAGARHKLQKLQLNYPSDDITFALKDSKDLPWHGRSFSNGHFTQTAKNPSPSQPVSHQRLANKLCWCSLPRVGRSAFRVRCVGRDGCGRAVFRVRGRCSREGVGAASEGATMPVRGSSRVLPRFYCVFDGSGFRTASFRQSGFGGSGSGHLYLEPKPWSPLPPSIT